MQSTEPVEIKRNIIHRDLRRQDEFFIDVASLIILSRNSIDYRTFAFLIN